MEQLIEQLNNPTNDLPCVDANLPAERRPPTNQILPKRNLKPAVEKCIDYIRAGDIFQVVLSQRLQLPITCDPFEIYRSLRVMNPSPFMFFLRTDESTLVGSSPEIMCRVVNNEMTVRPAGRHPAARKNAKRRPGIGTGTAGRRKGTSRARDAGRPRTQRCRSRRHDMVRSSCPMSWSSSVTATSCIFPRP